MTHKELLVSWLKNTYSLELAVTAELKEHLSERGNSPQIESGLKNRLQKTKTHLYRLENCIKRLDGDPSIGKNKITVAVKNLSQALSLKGDGVIKNAALDFGLGNIEITLYKSLISLALHLGDRETASICQEILRDEESLSKNLEKTLPQTTQDYIHKLSPKED